MRQVFSVLLTALLLGSLFLLAGGCKKEGDESESSGEEAEETAAKSGEPKCKIIEGTHVPSKRETKKQAQKICRIRGDFVIGRYATSLEGYSNLEAVEGMLKVRSTGELGALSGLSSLETIGGGLWVEDTYSLGAVEGMSSLVSIKGGIHIFGNLELVRISLERLERVEGDIEIVGNRSLSDISFPALVSIMGNVNMFENEQLTTLNLPKTQTILGQLSVRGHWGIKSVEAPSLETLWGSLDISLNPELAKVSVPALKEFGGELVIQHSQRFRGGDLKGKCRKAKKEPTSYEALVLQGTNYLVDPPGEKTPQEQKRAKELHAKRAGKAVAVCTKAVQMASDRADALLCLGAAHRQLEQMNEAIESYQKAAAADPKAFVAHLEVARIYAGQGEIPSARQAYQKCIDAGGDAIDAIPCKVEIRELGKKKP